MRARWLGAWLLAGGCDAPELPVEEEPVAPGITVGALWDGAVLPGFVTTLRPLVVTSPRTADGRAFYAADPAGGPYSGVRIELGSVIDDWPLPVGTPFTAAGIVLANAPATLLARTAADLNPVVDAPVVEVVPNEPTGEGGRLVHALVIARGLRVTSAPDPLGEADTDGTFAVGGLFGVSPGYGGDGDLVGILADGRVSARSAADWSGALAGDPPVQVDIAELDGLPDGAPVVVPDAALATPWSRDLRWALIQDADGRGAWIDAEGWGLWASLGEGDVADWVGEVRHRPEGVVLRVWDPPPVDGSRPAVVSDVADPGALVDGQLARLAVSGIGPADPYGERPADGVLLDDRFSDLAELGPDATVVGPVRTAPEPWIAPLPGVDSRSPGR